MDCTHSSCPSQFQQLFCVRVICGDVFVTVVYALLPGKTQQMYEEALSSFLDACLLRDLRPSPSSVIADSSNVATSSVGGVTGRLP